MPVSPLIWTFLAILLGPVLLGKLLQWYYSPRTPRTPPPPLRPSPNQQLPSNLAQIINQRQQPPQRQEWTWKLTIVAVCLALHELLILFEILLNPPSNIFTDLKMPVNTVVSKLRSRLLHLSETPILPPHLLSLLQKLQSYDTRTYYVRFGHGAITSCTTCFSFTDYFAYYAATVGTEYIRTCILMGIMTIKGSGKRRWRKWFIAAVMGAFFVEVMHIVSVDIFWAHNGKNCIMWADQVWWYRHWFFLGAPLLLYLLPYSYTPKAPIPALMATLDRLTQLTDLMNVAYIVRESVMRNAEFRQRTSEWYELAEEDASYAREDEHLQEEVEKFASEMGDAASTYARSYTEKTKQILESLRSTMPPKQPRAQSEVSSNSQGSSPSSSSTSN